MSHRRFAEEALALAPEDWRALSAVAEAYSQPLVAMDGLALTHVIPVDVRADVKKATELNGKAWEILTQRDANFQGRHVAANLVSLLSLLGRDEEAMVVLDQALATNLLARLLVNSSRTAPNDAALAAFHREYVAACHASGRPDDVEEVYGLVAAAAQDLLAGSINRVTLPPQLMATTNMHSPVSLTLAARKIARGEAGQPFKRLGNGGLTLDA